MENEQFENEGQQPPIYQANGNAGQQPPTYQASEGMGQQSPTHQAQQSTSGLAVAGLVLGILAILGAFVPLLNIGAIPFALVGLVLAIAGFVGIRNGKHSGRGIAIAGIVLGAVALIVICGMYGCAGAIASSAGSHSSASASSAAAQVSSSAASSNVAQSGSAASAGAQANNAASQDAELTANQESATDSGAVSPDLKDALDSYEAFVDEYVAFMERYNNSSDTASMMTDYLNYLQKYSDLMVKIEAIDTNSMSAADYAYYIEVTSRVSQKLLSVM